MSIYYKYAPDGTKIVVLSHVDDCFYWYTYETLGKWLLDTLGNIFHVKLLGYAHWFVSIIISQMKDNSISMDQARYATYIVAKYLDIDKVKARTKFIIPHYHLIWSSPKQMHLPVMIKLRSWLGNSIFAIGLVLDNLFICYLQ